MFDWVSRNTAAGASLWWHLPRCRQQSRCQYANALHLAKNDQTWIRVVILLKVTNYFHRIFRINTRTQRRHSARYLPSTTLSWSTKSYPNMQINISRLPTETEAPAGPWEVSVSWKTSASDWLELSNTHGDYRVSRTIEQQNRMSFEKLRRQHSLASDWVMHMK